MKVAIFIDGSYLFKCTFGHKFDYKEMINKIVGEDELLTCIYYDCLPYISIPSTELQQYKYSQRQRLFDHLEYVGMTVKLGRLVMRGTPEYPIFSQKRVDTNIAVDITLLAVSKQWMEQDTKVVIIGGDDDLVPPVSILRKFHPLNKVIVIHNGKKLIRTYPSADLLRLADESIEIEKLMED